MTTWIVLVVGLMAIAWIALEVLARTHRVLYKDVPLVRLFRRYVSDSVPHGRDGSSIMILHRASNTLVQVEKTLSKGAEQPPMANLRVLKKGASEPRWNPQGIKSRLLACGLGIRRSPDRMVAVPIWSLPSHKAGVVLLEIECGASLSKVEEAIEQIILEDPALAEDPRFDLWCENCAQTLCFGKFEEE